MKSFSNIMWGIFLLAVGIIWGINETGLVHIDLFFDGWWTLFIIVPSIIGLFNDREKTGNIIGIVIGIVLLLWARNIISFDLISKFAVPVILVIIGLSFIFKDFFNKDISSNIKKLNSEVEGSNAYSATFASQKVDYSNKSINGTNLSVVFGGIECNLSNAIFETENVLNVSCVFGGVDITVPNDVKVIIKSTSVFGGVDDNRKKCQNDGEKVLYINASCIFGGVDIK